MNDKKLIKFTKAFREGILDGDRSGGFCAMICWPLATLLEMNGVPCKNVNNGEHYWIVLADGRVLDPTYDQFGDGKPPVYLGPPIPEFHYP